MKAELRASDLRIGNWVIQNESQEECEIYAAGIVAQVQNKYRYAPIHLTSEWLERFGFRYTEEDVWRDQWINDRLHLYGNPIKGGWTVENIEPNFEIHHVHQLQNLYFALTNTELTLKEGKEIDGSLHTIYSAERRLHSLRHIWNLERLKNRKFKPF